MSDLASTPLGVERPDSPGELFRAFNHLALQGFGGVLPVAQRELVENRRWLTKVEFLELLSLGQVLPGPNIINMALIYGDRQFGWRGALAATSGLMLAPLAIVLLLAVLVRQGTAYPFIADALRGMSVVAAGLILSTAVKLSGALRANCMGLSTCVAIAVTTVVAVAFLHWPLVWVLAGVGPAAWFAAWWKLRPGVVAP